MGEGELHNHIASDPDPAQALALLESEMIGGGDPAKQIAHLKALLEKECEAQVNLAITWNKQQLSGRFPILSTSHQNFVIFRQKSPPPQALSRTMQWLGPIINLDTREFHLMQRLKDCRYVWLSAPQ